MKDQQTAKLKLASEAIFHVLNAIADDPRKFWLMGDMTGSFEKLTAAAAAFSNTPVEKIKADFRPKAADFQRYCQQREKDERFLSICRERIPTQSEIDAWKEVA